MTHCTCWCEYPNTNHKKVKGKTKCEKYKCIRQLGETRMVGGKEVPLKTKCVRIEKEK